MLQLRSHSDSSWQVDSELEKLIKDPAVGAQGQTGFRQENLSHMTKSGHKNGSQLVNKNRTGINRQLQKGPQEKHEQNSAKQFQDAWRILFAMFSLVALIWDLYGKLPAALKFHVLFCSIPSLHDDLPFTMILILFDIYLSLYWYSYYPHDSLNDLDNRSVL